MNTTLFSGDGRYMLDPIPGAVLMGTVPIRVTRAQARGMIKRFLKAGNSTHSGAGSTLWVILAHCQHEGVHYRLTALPREWYYVELNPPK